VQLKAIFFDLDGTLADESDSIADALSEACVMVCSRWPELNPAEVAVTYRQVSDALWGDFDRRLRHLPSAEAMLVAVWNQTLACWGLHNPTVEQQAAETYWQCRLRTCKPYPDALPLLQNLTGHFHLSLLTNGVPVMQRAKLVATGLAPFFQRVFVGGEFARGKPDQAIFRAALQAAGCRPNQALHVGDSLVHDIAGARSVGIHSVWLNRRGLDPTDLDPTDLGLTSFEHTPDFEIPSLESLTECLERLSSVTSNT
jgi:putative hydrolase of the HAD superfamily